MALNAGCKKKLSASCSRIVLRHQQLLEVHHAGPGFFTAMSPSYLREAVSMSFEFEEGVGEVSSIFNLCSIV